MGHPNADAVRAAFDAQTRGDRDAVLDAFTAVVRERHVARVRAHPQGPGARFPCRAGRREYCQRGMRQNRRRFPHHRPLPRWHVRARRAPK